MATVILGIPTRIDRLNRWHQAVDNVVVQEGIDNPIAPGYLYLSSHMTQSVDGRERRAGAPQQRPEHRCICNRDRKQ